MTMARRSRRGGGSVYWDASRACYVGAVSIGGGPETGKRIRRKVSAATEAECWDKLGELLAEKKRTGTVARRDITVERVVRDRLANEPRTVRSPITRRVHEDHAARIIAAIGKARLINLTPGQVEQRLLWKMADDGYAIKTIRDTRSLLAGAIRRAERDGLVGRNVALLADLPSGTSKQSRAMTLAQVGALLGSGLTPWWRAYITVGVMCGLRPGELLGLRWQDVDFTGKLVRVRYALTEADGGLVLADLKTDRSKRTLVMPAAVAAALRAHRTQQAADRLRLGGAYADMDLVFCRADGRPSRRQHVYKGFQRACSRAGIGAFHPHELRHTHVSVLSDHGVDMEVIADSVGHVNSTVTRTVYRHQIADVVARAASAMDQIFGTGSAS
jgi:integrase